MWDEELDVEKIITVKNTTYTIAIKGLNFSGLPR